MVPPVPDKNAANAGPVVIIGAGIAGLSLGFELVCQGVEVTIIDKGNLASGASGAAGAWLEPRPGTGKLRALEWAALAAWPAYEKLLERESAMDIGFGNRGVTHVAEESGLERLERDADGYRRAGRRIERLDRKRLHDRIPCLSENMVAGYHLPEICHLDARLTCAALARALQNRGGNLIENQPVDRIAEAKTGFSIEILNGDHVKAKNIVLAAGHGVNTIEGLPDDVPTSRPVRGVLLELQLQTSLISHPLKTPDGILIPLDDHRLLVGSSHEEGRDRLSAQPAIINQILAGAVCAVPAIAGLPIVEDPHRYSFICR